MTQDGFVQAADGEEYFDADLPEVDFENSPVDPQNPGFASLLPALQAYRQGQVELDVLQAYVVGLSPRLDAAFQQWESVAQQPLEQMGLDSEQVEQLRSAFSATEGLLGEMDQVLGLIERALSEGDEESLVEAEERLTVVHDEIRQALG